LKVSHISNNVLILRKNGISNSAVTPPEADQQTSRQHVTNFLFKLPSLKYGLLTKSSMKESAIGLNRELSCTNIFNIDNTAKLMVSLKQQFNI